MTTLRDYRGVTYNDRRVADRQGEKLYAGKTCANGHEGHLRYVSTGQCSECVRLNNKEKAQVRQELRRAIPEGSRLFAYKLHPDDHAAALAYCQALDLQRGRMPQAPAVDANKVPGPSLLFDRSRPVEPSAIAERRAELLQQHGPDSRPARRQLPAEMAATLRAHGLPV